MYKRQVCVDAYYAGGLGKMNMRLKQNGYSDAIPRVMWTSSGRTETNMTAACFTDSAATHLPNTGAPFTGTWLLGSSSGNSGACDGTCTDAAICTGACQQKLQWLVDNGVGKGDDELQLIAYRANNGDLAEYGEISRFSVELCFAPPPPPAAPPAPPTAPPPPVVPPPCIKFEKNEVVPLATTGSNVKAQLNLDVNPGYPSELMVSSMTVCISAYHSYGIGYLATLRLKQKDYGDVIPRLLAGQGGTCADDTSACASRYITNACFSDAATVPVPQDATGAPFTGTWAVSYTHLTLPTILLV